MVIGAAALIGLACLVVTLAPSLAIVTAAQIVMGAAAAIFPPAIAAIALGLVGPPRFTRRMGRMQAFNHAGNVTAAVLAGIVGTLIAPAAVFWLVSVFAALTIVATLAIDHDLARGFRPGESRDGEHPSGLAVLLESRPLLVFAAAIMLFHLANAAMLPLLGQELALHDRAEGAFFMSALIVVAQAVMVPMSILVGRRADRWGRKPLFFAGFLALPLRGVLLTLSSEPAYLIAVQVLDGVGAGIFGALFPVVVADLTRGTGRYNLAQGAVATLQGIGAAFSTTVAGLVVAGAGYDAAFLALAFIAVLAALLFLLAMPETIPETMPATVEAADLAAR